MTERERRLVEELRNAIEKLSGRYHSPRALEADMDILAASLSSLPERLTDIPRDEALFTLSDVIERYVEHGSLSASALDAVENLEELTQIADYDLPDEDRFARLVAEEIDVLKVELENLLAKIASD